MTRSKVKVWITEIWKLWKLPISKSSSSAGMHIIKRQMENCDTPRQYLHFNQTDFWYLSLFCVTWPSTLGCSTFGKQILPLTWSQPAVPFGAYFFLSYIGHTLICCYVGFQLHQSVGGTVLNDCKLARMCQWPEPYRQMKSYNFSWIICATSNSWKQCISACFCLRCTQCIHLSFILNASY